jgi:hypothetical protein
MTSPVRYKLFEASNPSKHKLFEAKFDEVPGQSLAEASRGLKGVREAEHRAATSKGKVKERRGIPKQSAKPDSCRDSSSLLLDLPFL